MCLNLLLCYSAVRWKSVISRRVKIYKSTVGKWEKKTWETEGEKVRGRSGREEEGGKSTPSTDHVKVNLGRVCFTSHSGRWTTADSRHRFNHSDVKLGICCTHASQSAVSFSFFFSRAAVRPAVRLSFPASASPQRCLSAVPCCRLLA